VTAVIQRTFTLSTCLALSLGLGALVAANPQIGFAVGFAVVGAIAVAAPAGYLVGAALIASLTFKGLGTIGLLPSVATFADIAFAWTALASAILRRTLRPPASVSLSSRTTRLIPVLMVALAGAILVSWAFNRSEAIRPFVYIGLLGEPFAIVAALLLDPPPHRLRRGLLMVLGLLVLIQVPLAFLQAAAHGTGDPVQGTLYGAGAGAHVMSAVVVVGALWVLAQPSFPILLRVSSAVAMLVIPVLADAKQVTFAIPALLLVTRWRHFAELIRNLSFVIVPIVVLVTLVPAGTFAVFYLQRAEAGKSGKQETAQLVWRSIDENPATLAFGKGPAETVSRAAFMTTPLLLNEGSPLQVLGLRPASEAATIQAASIQASGIRSSFNSGISSALGVIGDAGVVGLAAYLGLLGTLLLGLRRAVPSPERAAAAGGWAMFAVLGVVFDWWEQPPFGVVLGVLAGLALLTRSDIHGAEPRRGARLAS
jgi:hypothetical protein